MQVVSGGQTGADRAALDTARMLELAAGGWCPRGRRAEDGSIPAEYPLRETASPDPAWRTFFNVRDSDATLILWPDGASPGTASTVSAARGLHRPYFVANPFGASAAATLWLLGIRPVRLNVAGPRESEVPGLYLAACDFLIELLRPWAAGPVNRPPA